MNTIILDSIEDAQTELNKRKKEFPNLIHSVENKDTFLIIETLSTNEFLERAYFKQTGKHRTGLNKSISNLLKALTGYMNGRTRK